MPGKFRFCPTCKDQPPTQAREINKLASLSAEGVNFSVFAKHATGVQLLLFDGADDPEPARRPEMPRQGNKYAWLVGIVMFMVLGVLVFVQTIPNQGEGLFGPKPGKRLPSFAAPLVSSDLEGDANVCQKKPCPKNAGPLPACGVRSGRARPTATTSSGRSPRWSPACR